MIEVADLGHLAEGKPQEVVYTRTRVDGWKQVKEKTTAWVVKAGKEAQSETAASRLLWGVGYNSDVNYLVPNVRVEGLDKPLQNVRFSARPKDVKRVDGFKWKDNPFVGSRELQGLKVMMRQGSAWLDVAAQLRAVTERGLDPRHFILVTDDCHAATLVEEGHMDRVVRQLGLDETRPA